MALAPSPLLLPLGAALSLLAACTSFRQGAPDAAADAPDAPVDAPVDAPPAGDGPAPDVTEDAAPDAPPGVPAPRPVGPLSASRVTTPRPVLRWSLPPGVAEAVVEVCRDRACAMPTERRFMVEGEHVTVTPDLPPGVHYWRLAGRRDGRVGAPSPAWEIVTPRTPAGGGRAGPARAWGCVLDLNGDGLRDVAVGAPQAAGGEGRVFVYYGGRPLRADAVRVLAVPSSTAFGQVVACAGDLDGDGYPELAVSAVRAADAPGRVYVVPGGPTPADGPYAVLAVAASASFGWSLAGGGDLNGDGYGDLVVGQPAYMGVGAFHVYLGGRAGVPAVPSMMGSVSGRDDSRSGWAVAFVGDLDGDGRSDLAASAPSHAGDFSYVRVYRGAASGWSAGGAFDLAQPAVFARYGEVLAPAGDLDADGFPDLAVGVPGAAGERPMVWVFRGNARGIETAPAQVLRPFDGLGASFGAALQGVGDADGDGYDDLAVGDPTPDGGGVYVLSGSATMVGASGRATLGAMGSAEGFGAALGAAGDVDGDGLDDVLVGAPDAESQAGRAFWFRGATTGAALEQALRPNLGGRFGASL